MTAERVVLTLPNLLTVLRVVLVPVFAVALLVDDGHAVAARLVALGLFALAAVTDRLDGWLARRWDQVTDLGQAADRHGAGAAVVAR